LNRLWIVLIIIPVGASGEAPTGTLNSSYELDPSGEMNDDIDDIAIVRAAYLKQFRAEYQAQPALADILLDAQKMHASRAIIAAPAREAAPHTTRFASLSRYVSAATSALLGFFF
jgi:hypothetical protein